MRKVKHDTGTNRTETEANSCSRRYGKQLRVGVKIMVVALNYASYSWRREVRRGKRWRDAYSPLRFLIKLRLISNPFVPVCLKGWPGTRESILNDTRNYK